MGKFKYLIFIFLTPISLVVSIFIVNYLVNPFNYFSHSHILWKDAFVQNSILGLDNKNIQLYTMLQYIRKTDSNYCIIGSSRILRGFNTCQKPSILKVGLSAIDISDTKLLLKESLKSNSIDTIFIELHLTNLNKTHVQYETPSFWQFNLSLKAFGTSVQMITNSDNRTSLPNCSYKISPIYASGIDKKYQDIYNKQFFSDITDKAYNNIYNLLKEISAYRSKKLVFFIAPYHKKLGPPIVLNTTILRNRIKKLNKKNISIDVLNYLDYNNTFLDNALNDNTMWYDINHFKPILGDYYLNILLKY